MLLVCPQVFRRFRPCHLDTVGVGKNENIGVFVQRRKGIADLPHRAAAVLPPVNVSEFLVNQFGCHNAPVSKMGGISTARSLNTGPPEFRAFLPYSLVQAADAAGYSVKSEPSNSLAISPTEAIRSDFDSCGVSSPNS